MLMPEEFIFTLSTDLDYTDSSGNATTRELICKAPVSKHEKTASDLQQMLAKAMMDAAKLLSNEQIAVAAEAEKKAKEKKGELTAAPEEPEKMDAGAILMSIKSSSIDFFAYKNLVYDLLCSDLCFMKDNDSNNPMTRTLLSDMSLQDKDKLVGEYSANFIMASF